MTVTIDNYDELADFLDKLRREVSIDIPESVIRKEIERLKDMGRNTQKPLDSVLISFHSVFGFIAGTYIAIAEMVGAREGIDYVFYPVGEVKNVQELLYNVEVGTLLGVRAFGEYLTHGIAQWSTGMAELSLHGEYPLSVEVVRNRYHSILRESQYHVRSDEKVHLTGNTQPVGIISALLHPMLGNEIYDKLKYFSNLSEELGYKFDVRLIEEGDDSIILEYREEFGYTESFKLDREEGRRDDSDGR